MLSWFFFCQIEVLQTNGNVRLWWWIEIHHKNIFLLFLRFHERTIQLLSFPFFTPPSNTKSVLFFVNSFRFTLHFYVTKAKVSNKPVIWHFFSPKQITMYSNNTHSTSFYNSQNNLNIAQDWMFFLTHFSLFLPQAPSLELPSRLYYNNATTKKLFLKLLLLLLWQNCINKCWKHTSTLSFWDLKYLLSRLFYDVFLNTGCAILL